MKAKSRYLSLVICLVFAAIYVCNLSFAAVLSPQNKNPARKGSAQEMKAARMQYAQSCSKCHGTDGRGETVAGELMAAPNFTDAAWQQAISDERLIISITHGRGGMPAFKSKLTTSQIKSLVAFVRKFSDDESLRRRR